MDSGTSLACSDWLFKPWIIFAIHQLVLACFFMCKLLFFANFLGNYGVRVRYPVIWYILKQYYLIQLRISE